MMTEQEIERLIETEAERNRQDLEHIRGLAAEHNADLAVWCKRRRRREAFVRTSIAACIFIGCCLSYSSSMATPAYDQITTSGTTDEQHICQTIRLTIENI